MRVSPRSSDPGRESLRAAPCARESAGRERDREPDGADLLPPGADTPGVVGSYSGAGGRTLRYRVLEAEPRVRTLLYLHGIESHGAWFLPVASALRESGVTTYLLDRRGSGLNIGTEPGDASSPDELLEDVARFRSHVGDPELHLAGLSWGGKLAVAAALDRSERVAGLVLVTPGIKSRLRPSLSTVGAGVLGLLFAGGRNRVELGIEPEMFSARPEYLRFIRRDPLRIQEVTSRFLLTSLRLDRRIAGRSRELAMPILLCLAGRDPIVDNDAVLRALREAPRIRVRFHADAIHSLQFDERDALVREILEFVDLPERP